MKDRHVLDELSAYIDGAIRRPERIERHLRHCEDCARRHMELLKLRSHVAALRGPVARAGFEARVLARIEQADEPRLFPWRLAAGMAAVVLLTAVTLLAWQPWAPPSPSELVAESRARFGSDAQVRAALEEMADSDNDAGYLGGTFFAEETEELPDLTADEVILYLAEAAAEEATEAAPSPEGDQLGALPEEDLEMLESALNSYLYGG
ncbi:MAG: hypothetical protein IT368_14020 [Candidatus Hydrogenedentes bacterium]|nr:hypothetical protein [Candidatus Hydrogenedentota bacterium]